MPLSRIFSRRRGDADFPEILSFSSPEAGIRSFLRVLRCHVSRVLKAPTRESSPAFYSSRIADGGEESGSVASSHSGRKILPSSAITSRKALSFPRPFLPLAAPPVGPPTLPQG